MNLAVEGVRVGDGALWSSDEHIDRLLPDTSEDYVRIMSSAPPDVNDRPRSIEGLRVSDRGSA